MTYYNESDEKARKKILKNGTDVENLIYNVPISYIEDGQEVEYDNLVKAEEYGAPAAQILWMLLDKYYGSEVTEVQE